MNREAQFYCNKATEYEIAKHLLQCDGSFVPPLSSRVEISSYAQKICASAMRFEAWAEGSLVGLVASYPNGASQRFAYLTNVSVIQNCHGRGIASDLMKRSIEYWRELDLEYVELEVDRDNGKAIHLYERHGFIAIKNRGRSVMMRLNMGEKPQMGDPRNFDIEMKDTACHQYAYKFDFNVMHPYMIRSFEPFFRKGSLLELGSFKGDFTKRLLFRFDDVTCVEASASAIEEAKQKLRNGVHFIQSTCETVTLTRHFDNIVLTHVLEHVDEPVQVLKRINDEWLAERGRLFLVCPNANAASRQVAVKMGLISHNAAVTSAEAQHGHRRTYSLDTLERDATSAGLTIIHRSGIFFKALANFQWDRLLDTDIISKDFLDGCYELGQHYPDLCSSILLICEHGVRHASV